jgi:hypothetical protein
MLKEELEKKKKALEADFNKLEAQRQTSINTQNVIMTQEVKIQGKVEMIDELLAEME